MDCAGGAGLRWRARLASEPRGLVAESLTRRHARRLAQRHRELLQPHVALKGGCGLRGLLGLELCGDRPGTKGDNELEQREAGRRGKGEGAGLGDLTHLFLLLLALLGDRSVEVGARTLGTLEHETGRLFELRLRLELFDLRALEALLERPLLDGLKAVEGGQGRVSRARAAVLDCTVSPLLELLNAREGVVAVGAPGLQACGSASESRRKPGRRLWKAADGRVGLGRKDRRLAPTAHLAIEAAQHLLLGLSGEALSRAILARAAGTIWRALAPLGCGRHGARAARRRRARAELRAHLHAGAPHGRALSLWLV